MKRVLCIIFLINISLFARDIEKLTNNCNAGDAGSCDMLGFKYQMKKDYPNAAKYYIKGCDQNFVSSCYAIGRMYYFGIGVKRSGSKAEELFTKACKGGYEDACHELNLQVK